MLKWYEQSGTERPDVIYSRIRLARNWKEYLFPSKLSEEEGRELVERLSMGLDRIGELDSKRYACYFPGDMGELELLSLREKRLVNQALLGRKSPFAVLMSEEEDVSLVLNGTDHLRIQLMAGGLRLEELWKRADKLDDYINERFDYCYDETYGYLTSYPTNVGTGLRASVVIHLPTLSLGKKFHNLINEMGRFGASVRGVYGEGSENYGALYEISNQKTLGRSEQEIVALVNKVAIQLCNQERQVRELSLKNHRLEREDEAYKSYGVLKYARRLAMKDAMTFLSQLMAGIHDGLIVPSQPSSIYRLMLGIQPGSLSRQSDRPLGKEELEVARAAYLRSELPQIQ